jgi:Protein of unknown function (DUF3618)
MSQSPAASTSTSESAEPAPAPQRSPEEIEAEISETRARLARSVDDLAEEANPAALARKVTDRVRDFYVDESGSIRTDRAAKTAAAIIGFLVFRGIVRRGS